MTKPTALIVEDEEASREALATLVEREGFDVRLAENLTSATTQLKADPVDVVLSDLVLPDGSGLDLLAPDNSIDVVYVTGRATVETVIRALRAGAIDYLTKPVDAARLRSILRDVARAKTEKAGVTASLAEAKNTGQFGNLVGRSRPMLRLYHQIQKVARTEATVLLQGETGTGKELVARSIHELSERAKEPFVPLNCGAVSSTLIESELFGHEKGSFTGANRRHIGVFERANEGTLFLDEITEMPAELQVKLLRVLETREFNRVGGEGMVRSAARVIAATNRAPEEAVREGKLREDLFYRLRVFPIWLPPLHKRDEDVELLAKRFLDDHNSAARTDKTFSDEALEWMRTHEWPGNVRELENLVHSAFILADRVIRLKDVQSAGGPASQQQNVEAGEDLHVRVGATIAEVEKQLILATLEKFKGNKNKTARTLGISVKTLYTRLNVYEAGR